jgi:hypothetical protein
MRRAILLSAAVASATAAFAFASGPAQASGDIVSVKGSYTPGTIVIRTGERRLYYFVGAGEAIRRWPRRHAMVWHGLNQRQIHRAGVVRASIDPARLPVAAECRSRRLLA